MKYVTKQKLKCVVVKKASLLKFSAELDIVWILRAFLEHTNLLINVPGTHPFPQQTELI